MAGHPKENRSIVASVHVGIRVTPAEAKALRALVAQEGARFGRRMTAGRLIRMWIRQRYGWTAARLARLDRAP